MKVKVIGIGKCGSRITYDLFAFVEGLPTSYELRTVSSSKAFLAQGKFMFDRLISGAKRKWEEWARRELLIYEAPVLLVIDSDTKNNEITQAITGIKDEKGNMITFPGRVFDLSNKKGGCQYHIVSENICLNWNNMPKGIVSNDEADFVAIPFSLGGGTGGGSAPIISFRCKRALTDENQRVHYMGIGVLPKSNENYFDNAELPELSSGEGYNTGRFFVNLYSGRNPFTDTNDPSDRLMDSVWLISNDALEAIRVRAEISSSSSSKPTTDAKDDPNIQHLNRYVAESITVICNASSPFTQSQPNFDPQEMNNELNGHPFFSAYSARKPESGDSYDVYTDLVRLSLKVALSNMIIDPSSKQMFGLSVPAKEAHLAELNKLFSIEEPDDFKNAIEYYDIDKGPVEFATARKVVVLYGQPYDRHSEYKERLVAQVISKIFSNSDIEPYYYRYGGTLDRLLILIIDPIINSVKSSIYYYLAQSWFNGKDESKQLNDLIEKESFDGDALSNLLLHEDEFVSADFHGAATMDDLQDFKKLSKVKKDDVVSAFRHLHAVYHHLKVTIDPSELKRPRKNRKNRKKDDDEKNNGARKN